MRGFYVVGGRERKGGHGRPEWAGLFERALIGHVDLETGRYTTLVEHVTPPEACADEEPSVLFKAATLHGDRLYACTQTEVLIYRLPDFARVGYISLPCFNDVHHVRPAPDGTLLVASTGLELVVQVDPDGRVLREWNVLGESPWGGRFHRDVDYRKVPTTKPHQSHPNYVFFLDGEIWATRFNQRDAVCLTRPGRRIDIAVQGPHDGLVVGDRVYFTTVDGHVVIAGADDGRVREVVNLRKLSGEEGVLGWCRGLELLGPDRLAVGFSRLRPTKFVENVRWAKHQLGLRERPDNLPTRVSLYDLGRGALAWEFDLGSHGMDAIFSIHALDPRDARGGGGGTPS